MADVYAQLDPTLGEKARQFERLAAQEGIPVRITTGYRSPEEQARLYAQGRSAPGKIVTYAKPGASRHQLGTALDLVPLKDGQPDWNSPHWERLGALGESLGLRWGGRFTRLKDRPHFELASTAENRPVPGAGGNQRALITRLIQLHAVAEGVDPDLAVAVATQESSLDPGKVGDNGKSLGLFQLQEAAAIDAGIDPRRRGNIRENVRGGVRYLKQGLERFGGNTRAALEQHYNRGGDPDYYAHVMQYYPGSQPAPASRPGSRPGLLSRVIGAVSPASAEAASPPAPSGSERRGELMPASPVSAPDRQALEQRLQHLKSLLPSLPDAPSATPAPPPSAPPAAAAAPVAGPPTAATQMQMLEQQEQGRLAAERTVGSPTRPAPTLAELGRGAAATGISATGAMLGTAAGTLAAPFFGPAAPAIPLVGEMAGSYLARQANVALGLEDPGTLGDVLSVATPGIFGLRGVVRGLRQAPGPNIPMVPRGREQMAAEAQAAGVPLSYGEMTNQPLVKRAETALEQVPFVGTSGARRRQQEAVTQAATAEATWLREQMVQTPWRGLAEVQQAAQQGNRQAQQVLDDLNRAGEDWPRIVQASGNLRAYRARQVANRLYNRVEQLTQGMGYIEPARSTQVLDTVIQELDTAVVPDPGTQRLFEQMRERLLAQPRTYQQMRQFDSDVGDMVRDYYQGTNAVVGAKGVGSVTRLRAAIREDMDTFALQSGVPEVQEAVRRANRFYQRTVIPYEDKALAQALASETPDEIYRAFIQRGHRDRAQNFYTALDQRGRAAVQYGMVSEAMEKAMQPTTGLFSPAKFAGELERIREARGVFFRGQDAWQLDGLTRVMRAAERAGQFAENPPTGQRVIPWLILGGAGAGAAMAPGALAGTAAATRGLSWLLTSPAGSRLLLRAHRVGQETLAMQNILREIGVQGARVLATEGGEGVQEGTQVQVEPGRVTR